jgi:hypothetical protein
LPQSLIATKVLLGFFFSSACSLFLVFFVPSSDISGMWTRATAVRVPPLG